VWVDYVRQEISQAEQQGNKQASKDGIIIAVKKSGKVIRRGVGLPPWKQIVDELDLSMKEKK
jgi:hypothetical protein